MSHNRQAHPPHFLPLLVINRSTPRALVYGPLRFGGMKIVEESSLQDQWGLHYLIRSLRWDKTTAKDIRTVLNAFQLVPGFVCHALESLDIPITYLPSVWLPHL